jgi:antitoxin component YwqK of YwqJK toxin-antitoxin module
MRMRFLSAIVVLLAVRVAWAGEPAPISLAKVDKAAEKEAYQLNVEGLALHRKQDWTGAAAKYEAALAKHPGHLWARYNLACVYNRAGQAQRALALLRELGTVAACTACREVVDHSRFDDDWASQWTEPLYWEVLAATPADGDPGESSLEGTGKLDCPKGTKQKGTWRETDHGKLRCEKPDGTPHGPSNWFETGYDLSEGQQGEIGSYKHGKKDGLWIEYGTFHGWSVGGYIDGVKHGLWTFDHQAATSYTAYKQGKREGRVRTMREDRLILEEHYQGDQLHGSYKRWHEEPYLLAEEGGYDQGKKHGAWSEYDDAGKKRVAGTWDRGKRHGTFEYFDAKGKSLAKLTMDQDSGDWVVYDLDGKQTEHGKLVAGARQGRWGFAEQGWNEGEYEKGQPQGVWTRTDAPGGKKVAEGAYKAGKKHGVWTWWNDAGKVVAKGSYIAGKPDGVWMVSRDDVEYAQDLVFKKGKLVKVDGVRADKRHQQAYKADWSDDRPYPIEPMPEDQPY